MKPFLIKTYLIIVFVIILVTVSLIFINSQSHTAICKDGSTSYSKHRNGTCSDHGGVKEWNK